MSETVAATPSHYRYSDNPRTVRKPGGKHAGPIGVGAIPSIPANASSAGVSPHKILPFWQCSVPTKCSSVLRRRTRSRRPFCSVMEWQDCTVKMEVDIPALATHNFYSDRESFPRWMPFISSVKVLEDKPDLSKWSLKYNAFGQDIEYSWLARNMLIPIPNQKIHWRSLEGLPNSGCFFYGDIIRRASQGLEISFGIFKNQLTVSYEVPQLLVPVASALQPVLEGLLRRGLERFATLAKSKSS